MNPEETVLLQTQGTGLPPGDHNSSGSPSPCCGPGLRTSGKLEVHNPGSSFPFLSFRGVSTGTHLRGTCEPGLKENSHLPLGMPSHSLWDLRARNCQVSLLDSHCAEQQPGSMQSMIGQEMCVHAHASHWSSLPQAISFQAKLLFLPLSLGMKD